MWLATRLRSPTSRCTATRTLRRRVASPSSRTPACAPGSGGSRPSPATSRSMPDRLRPLWDFEDVEGTETRLREQLEREESGAGRAEVLTQLARVHSLR